MKNIWMTSASYLLYVLWIQAAPLFALARESSSTQTLVSNAPGRKRAWRVRGLLRAEMPSDTLSGSNAGQRWVSFQKIKKLAQPQPGEPGFFEASLSTIFTSSSFVDFDFGCFERSKASCPELAQVGNKYEGKGIILDARTIYNAKTVSPSFCAAAGFDGSRPYGSGRMTIKFITSVTRVGFYYLGASPNMFVRVVGHFGSAKSFNISNNADKKPDASMFFSVYGNGIESISIEGASYCIDDLRWMDETAPFTFDFGKLVTQFASTMDREWIFQGSHDLLVRVSGFNISAQSKTQFNGFVNLGVVNGEAKQMKVVVMNLYPLELYNYSYYGFQATDPLNNNTSWKLFVNGIPMQTGIVGVCKYNTSRFVEGMWLPRCWPSAMGQARSLIDGTLVFTWARLREGPIALSGLKIVPAKMHVVGRRRPEVVRYRVDETFPWGFRASGWLNEKSTTVDAGMVVHGPFNVSFVNRKLFRNMPPHDVVALSMRLWIERDWHNSEAKLGMGGYEAWRSSWNRSCENSACPVGWNAWYGSLSTYDTPAVCQPCFVDIAFGGLHTTLGAQAVWIGATLTDGFTDSWAFSHVRMTVGRITDTITTERRDNNDVELFRAGQFIERIFGNLPEHQLIRISFDYLSVGSWRDADAVVLLDNVEIFRRQRKVPDNCFVGNPTAFPTWDAAPQTNNTSLGIRCLWRVETAIPHKMSSARLVISSTASGGRQFFGYANFILQLGKESHQCQPGHCPDDYALLDDGPHWCVGVCTVADCCKRKEVCHSLSCDYSSGSVLQPGKMGYECRGEGGCSSAECCSLLGTCDEHMCSDGLRFLSKSDFCDGPICRNDECCESRALCSEFLCPEGHTSRPGTKHLTCSSSKCETHECCAILGQCSSTLCSSAAGWSPTPQSKTCQSSVCTREDCCQRLATCEMHSCPRGFDLKRKLPSFCASSQCRDQECCERTQGKCPRDLKKMCGNGWLPLQWPPERCAELECKMHECCSPLGQCLDIVCPKDWQPRDDPMMFCEAYPCTPTECCTPMFAGAETENYTNKN